MNYKFRTLLLAAGLGTRLRPLTYKTPKCLVNIAGNTLLDHWLTHLSEIGCESALVNTHYKSNLVEEHLSTKKYNNMNVTTSYEKELLGTAGTLIANKDFFSGVTGVLMHCDNISKVNLEGLLKAHHERNRNCILTMLTFTTKKPEMAGIITTDNSSVMTNFFEKVSNPPGDCANGAVYVFDSVFLDWLLTNHSKAVDFSLEVLPYLLNRVQTWHTNEIYIDIGTPATLEEAKTIFGV